ncbi:uncharacterized protein EI90DRAFT_3062967 [Cantharellus anzutake]|uniref:uncharacterized protein n=1 Tax=Cantharellus anzutake TaxID=1750568 RepID=UPI0019082F3B|nr:uncharacterized protein EI90DRAFT_3062967 [Cantharellus anzutake]KAF8329549.1 hypothetical protein EI90DRAFT_3062967 [Cantharellus anzutake]
MNTTSVSVVKRLDLWVDTARDVPEDKVQKSLERLIGIFTRFSHLIELTLFGDGKDLGSFPTMWTSSAQCQLETIALSISDDITQSKWGGFLTSQPKLRHLGIYRAKSFEVPPIPSLISMRVELRCGHIRFPDNMSSTLHALEYLSVRSVDTLSLLDMPSLKQLHCSDVQRLVMDSEFPNLTDVSLDSIRNSTPPTIPLPSLSKLRMVDVPLHLARGCTTLASVEFLDHTLVWPRRPHDLESLKDSALSLRSLTIREDHRSESEIPPSYQVIKTFTFLTDLTIEFHSILVRLCWSPFDQKCPTSSLFGVVKSLKCLQTLSWEVTVLRVDPRERDPTEEETTDYLDEGIVGGIVGWLDDMSDGYARTSPSLLHAEFRCRGLGYIYDMPSEETEKLGWWMRHTRTSIADPFERWALKEEFFLDHNGYRRHIRSWRY